MPPSHNRGTAAEQGAAARRQMEERQKRSSSSSSSPSYPSQSAPQKQPQPEQGHVKQASVPPTAEKPTPEKKPSDRSESTAAAAGTHHQKPKPKRTPFNMKRVQGLTGIDNLALLIETENYHPACFSVYMFESDLDRHTVEQFFEKLVELFPKYSYKVELDPSKAAKLDKDAQKHLAAAGDAEKGHGEGQQQNRKDAHDAGRKTHYAKGLKAGGPLRPAKWRILDDFDVRENIEEESVQPPRNSDERLFEIAGKFLERHFNYAKPLWEAKLVHGLDTHDGSKSALMIKIHHAVSDGQGLIQSYGVALSAIATGATKEQVQHEIESSPETKKPGQRGVKPTLWGTISHGAKTMSGLYFRSRKSFVYGPSSPKHRVYGRRYAHSKGISMEDIKLIRQAFSTEQNKLTLNDVACALLSRSMGIAAKRTSPDGKIKDKRVAVFVPISIRPKGNYELANLTTGAIAWFKLNEDFTLEERLAQVNREMTRIKRSWLPKLWYNSFGMICRARVWFAPHYPLGKEFFNKAYREYQVCTNVPGPNKPVKFGDHVAKRYFVMPPSSPGKATLAIGMISYAGTFSVAVSCDDVPEFQRLCQDVCESFQDGAAELIQAARDRLAAKKEAGAQ